MIVSACSTSTNCEARAIPPARPLARRPRRVHPVAEPPLVVLDSSVGVKWVKPEPGRAAALQLLEAHRDGGARIVVAAHFLHEVVGVAVRHGGPALGRAAWASLEGAELTAIGLDERLSSAAFDQCEALGCTFYDALAPALAHELGATLYSADARAHARFAGVQLI
jgi:predicted nucleic acid-binding protein